MDYILFSFPFIEKEGIRNHWTGHLTKKQEANIIYIHI